MYFSHNPIPRETVGNGRVRGKTLILPVEYPALWHRSTNAPPVLHRPQPSDPVDTRVGVRSRSDQSVTWDARPCRLSGTSGESGGRSSRWLPAWLPVALGTWHLGTLAHCINY